MKLYNDNKYQNFYNRLTFKGISVTLGTWVEGQPFFASLGQLGLATPKEYTNIFTLDDNQGVIAENFYCFKILPETLSQSTGLKIYTDENKSDYNLLFENDIIKFEYKDRIYTGIIKLVYASYIIVDVDNYEYICGLCDLIDLDNDDSEYVKSNVNLIGNVFDDYYDKLDDNYNDNLPYSNKRDFAQMLYADGGSKYLS